MASLDLDARRAEYADDAHEVTLGGQVWALPPRFPLLAVEYITTGRVSAAVGLLFGAEAIDTLAPLLNEDDLNAIADKLYGLDVGASATTMPAATTKSAPRSNGRSKASATR